MSRDFQIPDSPNEYVMLTLEQMKELTLGEAERAKMHRRNSREVSDFASTLWLTLMSRQQFSATDSEEMKASYAGTFKRGIEWMEWMTKETMYGKQTYAVYFVKEVNDV
jgi:hypothetical protein